MEDGHSCPSHGHETRSKHWLLDLDSRSIMRSCLVNISDMNVQATGIAALDRVATTRPVTTSHFGFGHNALNFRGRTPRLRFDRMSSSESFTTIHGSEASGEAAMPR